MVSQITDNLTVCFQKLVRGNSEKAPTLHIADHFWGSHRWILYTQGE